MEKFLVVGLRVEKYIGQNVKGFNCNFEYYDEEMERYHIYLRNESNELYRVSLEEEYGECGSGWCAASWGVMDVEKLEKNEPFTHRVNPKKSPLYIEGDLGPNEYGHLRLLSGHGGNEIFESDVFTYYENDGDVYYPCGSVSVNMDYFIPLKRAMEKRPVYIFRGNSGLGKSTIASTSSLTVFETDSVEELPDTISADIVVIGHKKEFDESEIISRLVGDPKVIFVTFSER